MTHTQEMYGLASKYDLPLEVSTTDVIVINHRVTGYRVVQEKDGTVVTNRRGERVTLPFPRYSLVTDHSTNGVPDRRAFWRDFLEAERHCIEMDIPAGVKANDWNKYANKRARILAAEKGKEWLLCDIIAKTPERGRFLHKALGFEQFSAIG